MAELEIVSEYDLTLSTGAHFAGLPVYGNGVLTVGGGSVRLEPKGPISGDVMGGVSISQQGGSVVLVKAALLPPWMNTGVLLRSERSSAVATLGGWHRGRFRKAAASSGFRVIEVRTLLSWGNRWVRQPPVADEAFRGT